MKSFILMFVFSLSLFNFSIEKNKFYDVLSSNSVEKLDKMISQLEKEKQSPINRAYKGTLIAKKASFKKVAAEKIKLFKAGVLLLETEIKKSPKVVEYRFLRLTIQENCPKILKYNTNVKEDVSVITKGYSKLNTNLKSIILDYSKDSKLLNSSILK